MEQDTWDLIGEDFMVCAWASLASLLCTVSVGRASGLIVGVHSLKDINFYMDFLIYLEYIALNLANVVLSKYWVYICTPKSPSSSTYDPLGIPHKFEHFIYFLPPPFLLPPF
jgi:hypothetical protein